MPTYEFKSFDQIPDISRQPPQPIKDRPILPRPSEKRGKVLEPGSQVNWKPIDKPAAMIIAKARWYNHPPEPKAVFMSKGQFKATMIGEPSAPAIGKPGPKEVFTRREANDFGIAITSDRTKERIKNINETDVFLERAKEVTAAIDYLNQHGLDEQLKFEDWTKKAIINARQSRIAMEIETRQLMSDLREVRAFFLDEKYTEEIARLERFVNLCLELKELKANGFLDTIADTILKLADQ